jgi:PIN domain nuclease of toxin-antitoxin system
MSKVLLDSHSWVWIANGDHRLKKSSTLKLIENAAANSSLFISSISVWEIAMLESKGRIRFQKPCLEWINEALAMPGLGVLDLSPEIAVESCRLPGDFHGDPADRIIGASARTHGLVLITQDQKILEYAKAGFLNAKALF